MFWLFCTKPIPGYEGLYRVSAGGVVESCHKGEWRRMKLHQHRKKGYLSVCLCNAGVQTTYPVHRLTLEAWHGIRPDGMEARHLNGVRTDNRLSNLAWGTRTENRADRKRHGTETCGERNGYAKLAEADVRHLRRLRASGWKLRGLAELFGVDQSAVSRICNGKSWAHVPLSPAGKEVQRMLF